MMIEIRSTEYNEVFC